MSRSFLAALLAGTAITAGLVVPASAVSTAPAPGEQAYDDPRYDGSTAVAVEGTLLRSVLDREDGGSTDAYAVETADGAVVPVSVTRDLPAGARFSGHLVLGGRLSTVLERRGLLPDDGRTVDGDTSAGRAVLAVAEDQGTVVPVADATVTRVAAAAAAPTPSAHTAYVVRMTDQGSVDGTDAEVGAAVDSMLAYWTTESGGAITSFTRIGAIRAFDSLANIVPSLGCGLNAPWGIWNDAASLFPGVDLDVPGRHLIVLVGNECAATGTVGVAMMGSSIASGGPSILTYAPQTFASTGAHELGHTFGLDHANLADCPSVSVCEYFDLYSPMALSVSGATFGPPALGTLYRRELGLTAPGEVATVALAAGAPTRTETFTLAPRSSGSGLRGLLVTDPATGTTYSVDRRTRTGRDATTFYGSAYAMGAPVPTYPTGVVVERQAAGAGETFLVTHPVGGRARGSWGAGETFAPSPRLSIAVGTDGEVTVTLGGTPPPPTVVAATPAVTGTVAVGRTVAAQPGAWTDGATFTYDWRLDGASTGATGGTYDVPADAVGRVLTVRVTGSRDGLAPASRTSAGATVAKGALVSSRPTISGTVKVGRTLTASAGTWSPGTTARYRWYAGSRAITSSSTSPTYRVARAYRGKRLTVKVTGSLPGYATVTRASAATRTVAR